MARVRLAAVASVALALAVLVALCAAVAVDYTHHTRAAERLRRKVLAPRTTTTATTSALVEADATAEAETEADVADEGEAEVAAEDDTELEVTDDATDETEADADADADAGARVLRSDLEWAKLTDIDHAANGANQLPAAAGTDGEMHWLREYYTAYALWKHTVKPAPPLHDGTRPVLMVGDAGMPPSVLLPAAGAAVGGIQFDTNPRQPPLTHAAAVAWASLTDVQRAWVHTYAAVVVGLDLTGNANFVGAPEFVGCHQTLQNALAVLGAGHGDALASAQWALTNRFGGTACDIGVDPAHLVVAATQHTNHAVEWAAAQKALVHHYTRFAALLHAKVSAAQRYDVWVLRDWLYATERLQGHRLVGASGYAVAVAGTAISGENWESKMYATKTAAGGESYGHMATMPHDTLGHVRPKEIGGSRDALNFVPQSDLGQVMVAPAEKLASTIASACGADQGRYTVMFGYDDVTHVAHYRARRPHTIFTVVDLIANCAGAGPVNGWINVNAQNGLMDAQYPAY